MTDNQVSTQSRGDVPLDMSNLTLNQVNFIGKSMAESGMFPDLQKDAAKALVKILAGQEIGVTPFQAMTGINIIQGKAAMGANIIAGKIKSSGKYDYRADISNEACTVTIKQRVYNPTKNPLDRSEEWEDIGSFTFTMDDARRIGLANKDNWKNYPANMLFARAITTAQRLYAPDATNGVLVYDPDELGAKTDAMGSIEAGSDNTELDEAIAKIQAAKDEDELTAIVTGLSPTLQKAVTQVASDKFQSFNESEATE